MFRKTTQILCLAAAVVLSSLATSTAQAQTKEQIQLAVNYYQGIVNNYCGKRGYEQVCANAKQMLAYWQQQLSKVSPPAPPKPQPKPQPPGLTREEMVRRANASRDQALAFVGKYPRPRTGYVVWYSRPPIYQGDSNYTPNPRPYYMTKAEAVREITRLTNNLNVITRIGTY